MEVVVVVEKLSEIERVRVLVRGHIFCKVKSNSVLEYVATKFDRTNVFHLLQPRIHLLPEKDVEIPVDGVSSVARRFGASLFSKNKFRTPERPAGPLSNPPRESRLIIIDVLESLCKTLFVKFHRPKMFVPFAKSTSEQFPGRHSGCCRVVRYGA